jgi:hypothetical protein
MDKALKLLAVLLFSLFSIACHAQIMQQVVMATPPLVVGTAPTIVQSKSTGSSGVVTTLTMTTPVTVGNILVAAMQVGAAGTTISFSDSFGNTPTTLASANLAADNDALAIVCAPITTGGADTLTFLGNGSISSGFAIVYEVHNAICTQDVTAVHSNTLASTSCNSGPMTTSTANDLLVGVCGVDGTGTTSSPAGVGWSGGLNGGNTGHPLLMSEYQIGTSPGSFTATSGTVASEEQATLLVAIKP